MVHVDGAALHQSPKLLDSSRLPRAHLCWSWQKMGGAVIALFALGLAFSAGVGVDRGHHDAYWICQSLFGGGTLTAAVFFGDLEIPNPIPRFYSLGYTLTAVSGLMNIVVIVDAYTVADRSEGGTP